VFVLFVQILFGDICAIGRRKALLAAGIFALVGFLCCYCHRMSYEIARLASGSSFSPVLWGCCRGRR